MNAYIICEGPVDTELLKTILPAKFLHHVGIVSAGGISSVKSLARSIVVRRQAPVAIVVDADSTIPELNRQYAKDIAEIVESVSVNTPVKVFLFVPEMEALFFQDILLLSRLLGYSPSQAELDRAVTQPGKVLEELISRSEVIHHRSEAIACLAHENLEILQSTPIIQELIHFLESVRELTNV
jgi:5S rRNA maturation endonuclease (ribonuclease M5)